MATLSSVSLAEILGALSLATDLANGNPMESALRAGLLASHLARELALGQDEAWQARYASLLRHIGCTSFAHEEALHFGDELASRRVLSTIDPSSKLELAAATVSALGKGQGVRRRSRAVGAALLHGPELRKAMMTTRCEVAVRLASRIGLGSGVGTALDQMYERWDGRGARAITGEAISMPARVTHVAVEVELHLRHAGAEGACAMVRKRSGSHFDPNVARAFLDAASTLLPALDSPWDAFLDAEPHEGLATAVELDEIVAAFADYIDLKSVYTLGHSSGVAQLAVLAGQRAGLSDDECVNLRRAALLHDLGRASVSTSIWEKKGKLTIGEWEQVRLHPYFTERILSRSPLLRPLAAIAAADHERVDGSGYPRSVPGTLLPLTARVLAAADVYHALTEERPHRPAYAAAEAASILEEEAKAGRLDATAVRCVLEVTGQRAARGERSWPSGLSEREVEVLQHLARGRSNKEIGQALDISARTAQHHVIHIYRKIGVSSRAAAALFAVENSLL